MTARQVTAPCPGRPGAAPAQARSAGRRPGVRGAETWPCGWDRREADGLARCRPATPGTQRGLSLCAPERSAAPGRGRRSRAMRSVAGQGRKSWRKLGAAPLPRRPCPAGKGGGTALVPRAAGTRAGVAARRGMEGEGAGSPGLPVEPQCPSPDRLFPPPACPLALASWLGGETLPSGGRNSFDLV